MSLLNSGLYHYPINQQDRCIGSTSDFVLGKADKACICAAPKPLLAADTVLCTDSGKASGAAALGIGMTRRPINLAAGIRVAGKGYHVQNANAYDSRSPGMDGPVSRYRHA